MKTQRCPFKCESFTRCSFRDKRPQEDNIRATEEAQMSWCSSEPLSMADLMGPPWGGKPACPTMGWGQSEGEQGASTHPIRGLGQQHS